MSSSEQNITLENTDNRELEIEKEQEQEQQQAQKTKHKARLCKMAPTVP